MKSVRPLHVFFALSLAVPTLAHCAAPTSPEDETGQSEDALSRTTAGATGDACTIDLPDGLKKPGKDDGKGHCCSIWDSTECYDKPSSLAQRGVFARGAATTKR